MKGILMAAAGLLVIGSAQAAELYRWVNESGVVQYSSEKKHPDAEKVKVGIPAASGVEDASLPFETRQAKKNFPVTLYVSESCVDLCNIARDYLKKRRVPFSEVKLSTEEELANFKKKFGTDIVPSATIGRKWFKGFQEQDWGNELTADGYPK